MKMYEITEDLRAIDELFNSAVDENGQPRELTDEEKQFLTECFSNSKEDFEEKFDSYGKYLAILKAQAEAADGERKAMKNEMDRLSARAKAYTNRRDSIKSYLFSICKTWVLKNTKHLYFRQMFNFHQLALVVLVMWTSCQKIS